MPLPELAAALALLLLTPGPTNTLMALAGVERGMWRAMLLIPAEVAAYLAVTLPLALAGSVLVAHAPSLRAGLTAVAAVWVAWLAVALWRRPAVPRAGGGDGAGCVTAARVFATTLMNPKALAIGLVLLPGDPILPRAALFAALIVVAAAVWIAAGATLAQGPGRAAGLRRVAAVWLGLLAAGLAYGAAMGAAAGGGA